ncbi:hypothetical protein N7G274_006036 [Stereocaulon virgatum]|uniref:Uncharacterized protein n=1 Tax=Stereocaulon virgatum TaxID=373712 RepID=A0ABR4A5B1_9LECA
MRWTRSDVVRILVLENSEDKVLAMDAVGQGFMDEIVKSGKLVALPTLKLGRRDICTTDVE